MRSNPRKPQITMNMVICGFLFYWQNLPVTDRACARPDLSSHYQADDLLLVPVDEVPFAGSHSDRAYLPAVEVSLVDAASASDPDRHRRELSALPSVAVSV